MKRSPLPFMGTHIANIALSPQLGLIFLFATPQRTHGLTEVSHETMLNDQLQVARWMIMNFLKGHIDLDESAYEPWAKIRDYEPVMAESPDPQDVERYNEICSSAMEQIMDLGDQLWNREDDGAVEFLTRLVGQIEQIVNFTNQRVDIIKCLAHLRPDDPIVMIEDQLMRLGYKRAKQIGSTFRGFGRYSGIVTIGYVAVKNGRNAERLFAHQLLEIARQVLSPEAIKRGYAKPGPSKD